MGLEILYEDRDIIVVNKAAGLLTMGTGRDGGRTAHAALDDYVKKGNYKSRERIFIVHRLDRDTSGALVFARTEGEGDASEKLGAGGEGLSGFCGRSSGPEGREDHQLSGRERGSAGLFDEGSKKGTAFPYRIQSAQGGRNPDFDGNYSINWSQEPDPRSLGRQRLADCG